MTTENEHNLDLRPGAIYRWHYRVCPDTASPYWCKSRIAVVDDRGRFVDTYWYTSSSSNFGFTVDEIDKYELKYLGHFDELEKRHSSDADYYSDSNIVDLNHANSSSGNFYIRKGATRSREKMRASAFARLERAESDIRYAQDRAKRAQETLAHIDAGGDLGEVRL